MTASQNDFWAITSYFNPAGYRRRLANFRIFRKHLGIPLAAVELSFGGGFELRPGDAEILVQREGGDVMFQKERLLNVALRSLPCECRKVAWIDCDVLFGRQDWMEIAGRRLDEWPLVHLFHLRTDLPAEARSLPPETADADTSALSSIYRIRELRARPEEVLVPGSVGQCRTANGLAWAARRDVLKNHSFYDACVVGGGDQALICAALGRPDHFVRLRSLSEAHSRHYRAWAAALFDSVRGKVGYVPGRIFHLWHGDLADRGYTWRYLEFARFDFDPDRDIALTDAGSWRWSSAKPQLHEFLRNYFRSRFEDGPQSRPRCCAVETEAMGHPS